MKLIWLGSGVSLYSTTQSITLFSWLALVFFSRSMVAASIVFVGALYVCSGATTKAMSRLVDKPRGA